MFKNNSEYIIPLVLKKTLLWYNNIKNSYIQKLNNIWFLVIEYNKILSENKLLNSENNFYNILYKKDGCIIKFIIPNNIKYLCDIIIKTGYKGLTKDNLLLYTQYWYKCDLCEIKNRATRESSSVIFFIIFLHS